MGHLSLDDPVDAFLHRMRAASSNRLKTALPVDHFALDVGIGPAKGRDEELARSAQHSKLVLVFAVAFVECTVG